MTQIDKTNGVNQSTTSQSSSKPQSAKRDDAANKSDSIFNNTKIIVQNGETPESLGKTFGVSSQDIISQNKDKWNGKWFKVGQEITLPTQIDSKDERLTGRAKTKEEAEAGWIAYKKGNTKPAEQKSQQSVQKSEPENSALHSGALVGAALGKAANNPASKTTAAETKADTTKVQQSATQESAAKFADTAKEKQSEVKPDSTNSELHSGAILGGIVGQAAKDVAKGDTTKVQPQKTQEEPLKQQQAAKTADENPAVSKDDKAIDTKKTNRNNTQDITYNKDGTVTLSKRVDERLNQMAQRLNCNVNDLKGMIYGESGFELNGKGSAAGLIQLTGIAIQDLNIQNKTNLTKSKIRQMDAMEQLDVAEKSLMRSKELAGFKEGDRLNASQLWAMNLYPKNAKKNVVLSEADGVSYTGNKGLDLNKDGYITQNEIATHLGRKAKWVESDLT